MRYARYQATSSTEFLVTRIVAVEQVLNLSLNGFKNDRKTSRIKV